VSTVFEPETISKLKIVKLPGYDTREGWSKYCAAGRDLGDTGRPQVNIIDASASNNFQAMR